MNNIPNFTEHKTLNCPYCYGGYTKLITKNIEELKNELISFKVENIKCICCNGKKIYYLSDIDKDNLLKKFDKKIDEYNKNIYPSYIHKDPQIKENILIDEYFNKIQLEISKLIRFPENKQIEVKKINDPVFDIIVINQG